MEVTILDTPLLERTADPMNPDRMTFRFRMIRTGAVRQAVISGNFGPSLPITTGPGEKVHLDSELFGWWEGGEPGVYEMYWNEHRDNLRGVGIDRGMLASRAVDRAISVAHEVYEEAMGPEELTPQRARYLLRLMTHELQDAARSAEVLA